MPRHNCNADAADGRRKSAKRLGTNTAQGGAKAARRPPAAPSPRSYAACAPGEHELQEHDVEPLIKLPAHLAKARDFLKSLRAMKRDAGRLLCGSSRDDRAVAEGAGARDKVAKQRATDSLAMLPISHIDRILDSEAISLALAKRRQGIPPHDGPFALGDDHGMPLVVLGKPSRALVGLGRLVLIGAG